MPLVLSAAQVVVTLRSTSSRPEPPFPPLPPLHPCVLVEVEVLLSYIQRRMSTAVATATAMMETTVVVVVFANGVVAVVMMVLAVVASASGVAAVVMMVVAESVGTTAVGVVASLAMLPVFFYQHPSKTVIGQLWRDSFARRRCLHRRLPLLVCRSQLLETGTYL